MSLLARETMEKPRRYEGLTSWDSHAQILENWDVKCESLR